MDKNYFRAREIINKARHELEKIYNSADHKGIEDQEANSLLEILIEKLEAAESEINYLSSPVKEGRLIEDGSRGKFYIEYDDKTESPVLNCGSALELYYNDEWHIGRVEATDGKYFFYGEDRPFLYTSMKARKRIID